MYISFYLLYSIFSVYLVHGAPSDLSSQFKAFTKNECPLFQESILAKEFLINCNETKPIKPDILNESNENYQLCLLYFDTFKKFCQTVNDDEDLKKSHAELSAVGDSITSEFADKIDVVCNSLSSLKKVELINPSVLEILQRQKVCQRVCTTLTSPDVKSICSLTTFLWNVTSNFEQKHSKTDSISAKQSVTIDSSKNVPMQPKDNDSVNQHTTVANHSGPVVGAGSVMEKSVQTVDSKNFTVDHVELNEGGVSGMGKTIQSTNSDPENKANKKIKETEENKGKKLVVQVTALPENGVDNLKVPNEHEVVDKIHEPKEPASSENNLTKPIVQQPVIKIENTKINEPNSNEEVLDQDNMDLDNEFGADGDDFDNQKEPGSQPTNINPKEPVLKVPPVKGNDDAEDPQPRSSEVKLKPIDVPKPKQIDEDSLDTAVSYQTQNIDDSDSYFFSYFMMVCVMFICGYVAYHNKQKILALVLEGRKGRRSSRTRRPNSANYRKLDTTLEEAVTSSCNKNTTQVIY